MIFRQIKSNIKIKEEKKNLRKQRFLFDEILNTTDNILLITDFKDVKFSNDKFKSIALVRNTSDFNNEMDHNMLNLFIKHEGYLHAGLLKR